MPSSDAPAPPLDAAAPRWVIASGRVGALVLGQPLPPELATDELGARYVAAYIADGVPFDGFRFDDPPLTAAIADGPFAAQDRDGPGGPPVTEPLRAKAAVIARAGAKVTMVMIHGPGPATAAGVGVGADLAALTAAYPDLRLWPRPPTRERDGLDTCVGKTAALPGVGFVFTTCNAAKAGKPVTRVDLWMPDA